MEYAVAITGASGSVYGVRLVAELLARGHSVVLLASDAARLVMSYELGLELPEREVARAVLAWLGLDENSSLRYAADDDLFDPICSGSRAPDGVIVAPCSMATLGGIACGIASSLIERAADVALKERRTLILVPRETPLNLVHLRNMVTAAEAGAIVLPPMPAFYPKPKTVDEMVDFVVGKILDQLGIEHDLFTRWRA